MQQRHPKMVNRTKPRRKKPSKLNLTPYEGTDQARVCDWLRSKGCLFYAIPNDGKRSPAMAAKAAATGLQKGMLDLCIAMPRAPYHGLYIEMKRKEGGVVSEWQKYWIDALRSQGFRVEVCRGYDAAIRVLEDYFNGSLLPNHFR